MKAIMSGFFAVFLVAGCGGGGGDNGGSSTTNGTSKTAITSQKGDTYTYKRNIKQPGDLEPSIVYYLTHEYQTINGDGSLVFTESLAYYVDTKTIITNVSATGGITQISVKDVPGSTCTNSPENIGSIAPYTVGKTWDSNWTRTCGPTIYKESNKGSIVGQEVVTVPAGTFTTVKEVFTTTTEQTSPVSTTRIVSTRNFVCWRDVRSGMFVRCERTLTYVYPTGTPGSWSANSLVDELIGYNAAGSATNVPTVARFGGYGAVAFSGSDSGTCTSIYITDAGKITGTCTGSSAGSFSITGSVDAQGNTTFSSTGASGFTGTGQFTSTLNASGTWKSGTSASGTWTLTHH
jgi:hypothetical protein